MKVSCGICEQLFGEDVSLLAAPCGHVFHSECLMSSIEKYKFCPICLKPASAKDLLELKMEYLLYTPGSVEQQEIQSLEFQVRSRDIEIGRQKRSKEHLKEDIEKAKIKMHELQQLNFEYESEIKKLTERLESLPALEKKSNVLSQRNSDLKSELSDLKNIKLMVSVTKKEVRDILNTSNNGPHIRRKLAIGCYSLKAELEQVRKDKNKREKEVNKIDKKVSQKTIYLRELREEINTLREQVSHAEEENKALQKRIQDIPVISDVSKNCETPVTPDHSKTPQNNL